MARWCDTSIGNHCVTFRERTGRMKSKTKVKCPDCDRMFYPNGLGPHRAKMHGGETKTIEAETISPPQQSQEPEQDPLTCAVCGFVAKSPLGLSIHNARHKDRSTALATVRKAATRPIASNGASHTDARGSLIPDQTLALALGRFQELCASIATQHDLPPRTFASRLAELIYATTLR